MLHKGFQGQILDFFCVSSDPVGEHVWRQTSVGAKSSQDISEFSSGGAPLSLSPLTAAGFKDNSAPTLDTWVKYLHLHGITLGPSVGGKSNLPTTAEELATPGLPIFPSFARQLIPACPNQSPFPFCCHPTPALRQDTGLGTLRTSRAMLKAKSQPGMLPSHSWFIADAHLKAGVSAKPNSGHPK